MQYAANLNVAQLLTFILTFDEIATFVTLTELGNAKIGIGIGRELTDNDIVLARALDLFIRAGGVGLDFVEEIPDPYFGFVDQGDAKGFEVGILPTAIEF